MQLIVQQLVEYVQLGEFQLYKLMFLEGNISFFDLEKE